MTPFEHGGDVTAFAKACNCEVSEVIDLSSNINFVKPSIEVDFNALDIAPYPNYDTLYEAIASHYDVEVDEMELFNGGSSSIFTLFRWLSLSKPNPHCTIYSPAYLEYKKASEVFGYEIDIIDRFNNFNAEVKEGSLVVFVNPSTPDGCYYDMDSLLKKWIAKKCTILVDESFLEFTDKPSVSNHIKNYDKLYILKSMTKFYGAAGIRIGSLISNNMNIETLRHFEPAWKLSSFDSHYIQEAIKDKTLFPRTHEIVQNNRTKLIKILGQFKYVEKVFPSSANYMLIKLRGITADTLQEKLIPFKILIRNCANFDGLDSSYVRIAIKELQSIEALPKALDA